MKIERDGKTFEVYLVDEGTLDTVIQIEGTEFVNRFDQEYASSFRDEQTGELTEEGFRELAEETVEDYLEQQALEA